MAPGNWSNGQPSVSELAAASGQFDHRVHRALAAERYSPSPGRSSSPTYRTWSAKDTWSCGGKEGCGFRKNQGPACLVCAKSWGHWQQAWYVEKDKDARPHLANSFQGFDRLPPWKKKPDERNEACLPKPSLQAAGGKGKGKQGVRQKAVASDIADSPSPTAEEMDVEHPIGLGKLRLAYAAVAAAMGPSTEMAETLLAQIREEEARKSSLVLPHVQLQRTQKKLEQLSWKADQALLELNELEDQRNVVLGKIIEVQAKGRALEEQIAEAEATKKSIIAALANMQGVIPVKLEPAVGQPSMLQYDLDLQRAGEVEQCRPMLQEMEMLVARIREACAAEGQEARLLPTQLQGTVTPVQSPVQGAEEETQPGLPSFGPAAPRVSRFRANPYTGQEATKEESQTYTGRDLGLEGASATEYDAQGGKSDGEQGQQP